MSMRETRDRAAAELEAIGNGQWSTWNEFAYDHERGRERSAICDAAEAQRLSAVVSGLTLMLQQETMEFVGWLCPCHRRVVRPNPDGSKPDHHLISNDEGLMRCNISPDLWQRAYVLKEDT